MMTDDRDYAAELMARIAHLENHIEAVANDTHKTMVAYEAALPAVYRLALADAVNTLRTKRTHMYTTRYDEFVQTRTRGVLEMADMIEASPTPTAAELRDAISALEENK